MIGYGIGPLLFAPLSESTSRSIAGEKEGSVEANVVNSTAVWKERAIYRDVRHLRHPHRPGIIGR